LVVVFDPIPPYQTHSEPMYLNHPYSSRPCATVNVNR
jgi:hypothetical protein